MEDACLAKKVDLPGGEKGMVFGVFDGHGGKEVAVFAADKYIDTLTSLKEFKDADYKEALIKSFYNLDEQVSTEDFALDTGCTSNVILITPTQIFCANAGDSRSILVKKGVKQGEKVNTPVIELSKDHKPGNTEEEARINAAGHFVSDDRVDGNLALSRAFGDFQYKDQKNKSAGD